MRVLILSLAIGPVSKYLGTRSLAGLGATSGQSLRQTCQFRYRFIDLLLLFFLFEALRLQSISTFLVSRCFLFLFLFFFFLIPNASLQFFRLRLRLIYLGRIAEKVKYISCLGCAPARKEGSRIENSKFQEE